MLIDKILGDSCSEIVGEGVALDQPGAVLVENLEGVDCGLVVEYGYVVYVEHILFIFYLYLFVWFYCEILELVIEEVFCCYL